MAIVIGMTKDHLAIFADAMSRTLLGINTFQKFSPSFCLLFLFKGKFESITFILFCQNIT